ncbi:phosphotransferase family protein [Ktedonobacter sp. SOSP1-52]|uniref:phosphotransferase family protein n=1 Tax=Ktedonobacter sp. SOSP1-52 TaxID=2778366 RepID=UPI0019168A5F|nr:aminoglycoside phosphotransferase family protein [Ktedonobacter sp. SOSP1-52]
MIQLDGPVRVTFIRAYNHVYQLDCQDQTLFLKIHTKDWYPPEDAETGYSVAHEASAWSTLASYGLASPEVVLACQNQENPLGRSFLLTRRVPGTNLTTLLDQGQDIKEMLSAVGDYLRRMHSIPFAYAGYLLGEGPTAPPDPESWQHPIWTVEQLQKQTNAWVEAKLQGCSAQLLQQIERQVQQIPEILTSAYVPPHFTHGDCGPDQMFMIRQNGHWQVSALLDMEVASAGDTGADLVSFCTRLAQRFPATSSWWLPFFEGYGSIPDFEGFRLRLLSGWYPYEPSIWPGTGEVAFWHLLRANNWETLFSHAHLALS